MIQISLSAIVLMLAASFAQAQNLDGVYRTSAGKVITIKGDSFTYTLGGTRSWSGRTSPAGSRQVHLIEVNKFCTYDATKFICWSGGSTLEEVFSRVE
jgi:hypothetical protein